MIWLPSSILTRFSPVPVNIPFRNLLNDCLVWTTRQCFLMETRKGHEKLSSSSSEESCEEEAVEPRSGPRPRKIRKLLRVKSKLRNIKVKLDEAYLAGLTEKYRRTSALINRGRRMNHHALTQLTALVGFFAATNSIHFQNIWNFIHTSCNFFLMFIC